MIFSSSERLVNGFSSAARPPSRYQACREEIVRVGEASESLLENLISDGAQIKCTNDVA